MQFFRGAYDSFCMNQMQTVLKKNMFVLLFWNLSLAEF